MKTVRIVVVVYGLFCLLVTVFILNRVHYGSLVNSSPSYVNNRFYVMSLFFPRWEAITKAYDPASFGEKTPKWYDVIKEPRFVLGGALGKSFQENKAREYIKQYVEDSSGIDHKKVERWLFEIINFVNHKVTGYESFEEVFLGTGLSNQVAENHLMQVVSFIPLREQLRIFQEDDSIFLLAFPVLFGLPLLFVQICSWGYNLIKGRPLRGISLTRKSSWIFLVVALAVGIYYLISGSMDEYETAKMTAFVSGRWFWLQMGCIYGLVALLGAFLWFWGLTVLCQSFFAIFKPSGISVSSSEPSKP